MTPRCLLVDLNGYFASVERNDCMSLRGRLIGEVPVMAATTCFIAASYEAKAFGYREASARATPQLICPTDPILKAR